MMMITNFQSNFNPNPIPKLSAGLGVVGLNRSKRTVVASLHRWATYISHDLAATRAVQVAVAVAMVLVLV